jgi:CRISPR-associated exonuclease Cas4
MNLATVGIALLLLLLALGAYVLGREVRQSTGLPSGRVIYTDTSAWQRNEKALFSASHRLTGKPDYLIRDGKSIIPVELKSGAAPRTPREGHILQLAAYCLLVEECMGTRPTYGIIQYADRQFAIDFTEELQREVQLVVQKMRSTLDADGGPHRSHADAYRCAGCGVRESCDERLGK